MLDVKGESRKNCEIFNVYKKLPEIYNEYLIKIKIPKDIFFDVEEIKIQSSNLLQELKELADSIKERCYLAYGMADIDIYKKGKQYVIMNSPHEGLYIEYYFTENRFKELIKALQ